MRLIPIFGILIFRPDQLCTAPTKMEKTQTRRPPEYWQAYRCVLALSNIGVSLLERHAYSQAVETLRDAVTVMRDFSYQCSSPDFQMDTRAIWYHQRNNAVMGKANRRMARANPERGGSFVETIGRDRVVSVRVPFLWHQHPGTSPAVVSLPCFPIRVEDFDECERDLDLDAAMVLHNFATAQLCLSRITSQSSRAQRCRTASCRSAELAYAALAETITAANNQRWWGSEGHLGKAENVALLSVCILNTMIRAQMESGKLLEAGESHERLRLLQVAVKEVTDTCRDAENKDTAAAA
ncbi:predicted protein [Phaeodactylum tricornutum CCAP 1055/1]|uniref:Uncharacterized protein n=1 Tax=Phaeodactylum tricornutum (strain CCAP 1055/1) TaxID=556484 RepID=B7GC40_PHATC|nr:predicted protein [Phaeodactylum tricornutum CCAP 1055/1]EEC43797.1 predicted protein [Phaeodactylum tricornutum CCAP 1055/1]|eukprot:XP_002184738.1 predicted protein [Phaeodactylum tricornutum CCAP 1055/1]